MNKKMILGTVAATLSLMASAVAGGTDGACCSDKSGSNMESTSNESMPAEVTLASLMKTPISTTDGKNLGQVQDMVFDVKTGKIQAALVGRGSTFGTKDKLVPVPWEAVTIKPPQKQFTLTVDQDKLVSSSDNENTSEEGMNNQPYAVTIYRFYAVPDDEQDMGGATTPGGMAEGQGSSDDSSADVPSDQQDTGSDADTVPHA